ncbi:putative Ccc1 family protein [Helianthus annuus]|nr:putative Ccc1 family protein [Helianthus annuus]
MANEGWEQLLLGAEQWRPEVKEGAETMVMSDQAEVVEEEEVVKLEFEKVKPKLATHSMHCPNCRSEITKVILRRKVYRPNEQDPVVVRVPPVPEQKDLVRCFSCSSLFTCSGILAEILKSIVYGGLMEVIASLSVVVSAAASNVTTLSIVSLALASLIGGVIIVGHNLWDLKNDCYKNTSSQETKNATTYKYKALLGQVNHFPLHAFFAILSFLMFGMVPPIAYRYSYHETKDKEYTLAVVALASLLCVLLLAILKAYINKCTVFKYFKTAVYYIIIAVLVSGVSYVVGNLVARLLEEPGWFATSSSGGMPCVPRVTSSYLESF